MALSQKMKEDLDKITHTLLAERSKRTSNEGEKELLSAAAHILLCKGCGDERYTQTHLIHNLLTWLSPLARYKDSKKNYFQVTWEGMQQVQGRGRRTGCQ